MYIRKIKGVKVGGCTIIPADKITNILYEAGSASVVYIENMTELPNATKEIKITARQEDIEVFFGDVKV